MNFAAVLDPTGIGPLAGFAPMGPLDPPFKLYGAGYDVRNRLFADIEARRFGRSYEVRVDLTGSLPGTFHVEAWSDDGDEYAGTLYRGNTEVSVTLDLVLRRAQMLVTVHGGDTEMSAYSFDLFLHGR